MKKVFFYMSSSFHNSYLHMVKNAPEGFDITPSQYMAHIFGAQTASKSGQKTPEQGFIRKLQPSISPLYNRLLISLGIPKSRRFSATGYDLVHSGQSILDTNVPYVMDFEHAAVFSGYNQYAFDRPGFRNALKKKLLDKNLKRLMPWSDAAKRSLLNFVKGDSIEDKVETVYPVVTPPEKLVREKHEGINFLFVGGIFFEKGGYDTMLAFDRFSERYDCTLSVVSNVPDWVCKKFSNNKKIRVLGPKPYEEVKKLYSQSDVFVLPTHYDTVGFVIPEAFSYGLPVISDNSFSRPEIIEHERTGLLVDSYYSSFREDGGYIYPTMEELGKRKEDCMHPTDRYISDLSQAMIRLVEEDKFRKALSENAIRESREGKFSPKIWKEKMGRIYGEALRK